MSNQPDPKIRTAQSAAAFVAQALHRHRAISTVERKANAAGPNLT